MRVFLVQHGEAQPESVIPERPLTDRGRRDIHQIAALVGRIGADITEIRHSGKLRAEETAYLLRAGLSPQVGVVSTAGLDPNDDVQPIVLKIKNEERTVMLVGHLPFLSRLVSSLVLGTPDLASGRNGELSEGEWCVVCV